MEKIKIGMIGTLHDHASGKMECINRHPEVFDFVGFVPDSDERIEEFRSRGFENYTFLHMMNCLSTVISKGTAF